MLTAVCRLCGQPDGGPSGVAAQSTWARSRPTSGSAPNTAAGQSAVSVFDHRAPSRSAERVCHGLIGPQHVVELGDLDRHDHFGVAAPPRGRTRRRSVPARSNRGRRSGPRYRSRSHPRVRGRAPGSDDPTPASRAASRWVTRVSTVPESTSPPAETTTAASRTSCLTSNNATLPLTSWLHIKPNGALPVEPKPAGLSDAGRNEVGALTVASGADAVVHGQQQMIELAAASCPAGYRSVSSSATTCAASARSFVFVCCERHSRISNAASALMR